MLRAALALPLVVALAAGSAHADARSEARAHLVRATELHGQGKFADALTELTVAYSLDPQPDFLYAIAQTHVQLGDCTQAILFYKRFLSTRPERVAADAALEAIDVCEHAPPPPPRDPDPPPPDPTPPPPPDPVVVPPPPPPPVVHRGRSRDVLGLALVGGGLALGAAGGVTYALAVGDLDHAEAAPTYAAYMDLVDSGHRKRLVAGILGGAGVVVAAVGVVHLVRHSPSSEVAVVPASGGGVVTWAGRF